MKKVITITSGLIDVLNVNDKGETSLFMGIKKGGIAEVLAWDLLGVICTDCNKRYEIDSRVPCERQVIVDDCGDITIVNEVGYGGRTIAMVFFEERL